MNPKDPAPVRAQHQAADRHQPALARLITDTLHTIRAPFTPTRVAELLDAGRPRDLFTLFDTGTEQFTKAIEPSQLETVELSRLETVLLAVLRDGALAAAPHGPGPENAATLAARFDLTNPYAVRYARSSAAQLVYGLTEESRATLQQILARALRYGGPPRQLAAEIADIVGLTPRQAVAAINYRRALEDTLGGPDRSAVLRRRFALSPLRGRVTTGGQVDRLVSRYVARQLRARALMVARTETVRAAAEGELMLRREMMRRGLLDPSRTVRVWSTAHDERVCPVCGPMDGQVIVFGQRFAPPDLPGRLGRQYGGVVFETPPAHPSCRCAAVTKAV